MEKRELAHFFHVFFAYYTEVKYTCITKKELLNMNSPKIKIILKKSVYVSPNSYYLYHLSVFNLKKALIFISDGKLAQAELSEVTNDTNELFDRICALKLSPEHLCDVIEDIKHAESKIFE